MQHIIEQLRKMEERLDSEWGPFKFFALLEPEAQSGRWDLVVAAPWIGDDVAETIELLSEQLGQWLTPEEMLLIARVVVLDTNHPLVEAVTGRLSTESSAIEISNCTLDDIAVARAFIITARSVAAQAADRRRPKAKRD